MVISQKSTKRPMTLLYKHSNEKLAHILEKFTVYLRKELWAEKWIPKTNRTVSLLIVERGIQGKTYFSRIKEDNKVQVPILYKNISESNIPICYPQEPKFWHCTWMWFDGILWKKKKKIPLFFFLKRILKKKENNFLKELSYDNKLSKCSSAVFRKCLCNVTRKETTLMFREAYSKIMK